MVFMTVGQEDTEDFIGVFFEVSGIGDDEVNAEHAFIREAEAAVDDENFVLIFDSGHISADFVTGAKLYHGHILT